MDAAPGVLGGEGFAAAVRRWRQKLCQRDQKEATKQPITVELLHNPESEPFL